MGSFTSAIENILPGCVRIFFLGRPPVLLLWLVVAQLVDFACCLHLISWAEPVCFVTFCAIRIFRMGSARTTLQCHWNNCMPRLYIKNVCASAICPRIVDHLQSLLCSSRATFFLPCVLDTGRNFHSLAGVHGLSLSQGMCISNCLSN